MNHANLFRLVSPSAIRSASFLLLHTGAPALGPAWLIFLRVFALRKESAR